MRDGATTGGVAAVAGVDGRRLLLHRRVSSSGMALGRTTRHNRCRSSLGDLRHFGRHRAFPHTYKLHGKRKKEVLSLGNAIQLHASIFNGIDSQHRHHNRHWPRSALEIVFCLEKLTSRRDVCLMVLQGNERV